MDEMEQITEILQRNDWTERFQNESCFEPLEYLLVQKDEDIDFADIKDYMVSDWYQ
jgi:hypothetical protein